MTPKHVVIVSVDDQTFVALKDDPLAFWQPHFAQAMKVIDGAGAAVTGLDFVYATSAETWLARLKLPDTEISRTYDKPFRERIAAGRKILEGSLVEMSEWRGGDDACRRQEHYFLLEHINCRTWAWPIFIRTKTASSGISCPCR